MSIDDAIQKEYQELTAQIRYFNQKYEDGEAEITDAAYDEMMQRLKAMEAAYPALLTPDSPSQRAGAPIKRKAGVTVTHRVPMLSIRDVFSLEDVFDWTADVRKLHPDVIFSVEMKIDGLSMTLRYEAGRLRLAETRGDGFIGEDVTLNALVIPDVPEEISEQAYLELRGEVYMTHADFDRVNAAQERNGKKVFANPRNCAAGTLRQLDPAMTKERGLSYFLFNVQDGPASYLLSQTENLDALRAMGMPVVPAFRCTTDEEIEAAIQKIAEMRGSLDFDIDGAVVKIDQIAYRDDFPAGSKYSAGHVAYKYPPEEKESVIRDIEISIGMTGRVNPTAVFDPIRLCGTTVTRATLHNQDFIDSLHIGIGDTVVVYKSGEIIPKIRCSVPEKRPQGVVDFKLPTVCPVCGGAIVREQDAADMRCINPNCPAQLERHLIHFVGRDAMDIKGFGEENLRALMQAGLVKNIADIYRLRDHRARMLEQKLIGLEKSTDKLLAAIEQSKENPPWRLLSGLAIENVGSTSARTILRHFTSFEKLMAADREALLLVPDVGEVTADSIRTFFAQQENRQLMQELASLGLRLEETEKAVANDLAGRTYVVTGDLTRFENRAALSAYIEERGGRCASAVSKKTTALINNDVSSSSGKNQKAKELGIPIISEEEFLAQVEGGM